MDYQKRPLYLYSLPPNVLDSLAVKDISGGLVLPRKDESEASSTEAASSATTATTTTATVASSQACALCGQAFDSVGEQRSHLKSDLHTYNLRQKLRGQPAVNEAEFDQLVGSLDESLSGSDDSSDSEGDGGGDEKGSGSDAATTAGSGGGMLAALLKKQAVLSEKEQRQQGSSKEASQKPAALPREQKNAAAAAAAAVQPLVWFSSPLLPANHYFGVYRVMFTAAELEENDAEAAEGADREPEAKKSQRSMLAALRSRQLAPIPGNTATTTAATTTTPPPPLPHSRHVFLCMIGGGHFAAMVVALAPRKAKAGSLPLDREAVVLAHKTFHRYTTRRKQGGSQSANDAAKGAAHSAGSTLRRYNEQALVDDVRGLLAEWRPLLDTAELLFVRAAGTTNRRTLFGPYEGQVLRARDERLRGLPFPTRRPTLKELMRVFIELTRLKVREVAQVMPPTAPPDKAKGSLPSPPPAAPQNKAPTEAEQTALLHTAQLQALARRLKVPALLAYLQTHGLSAAAFTFAPADAPQHHHAPTLLHLAAAQNAPALVAALLLRAGADPTARNAEGRTPFELAGDRATRDAFRVARQELTGTRTWDWAAARVPAPMTRAEAEQRESREKEAEERQEAERRRAEAARLQTAKAQTGAAAPTKKITIGVRKSAQEIREEEQRGLTPEQRQRLEREKRARAAEERLRRMQQ